ncbi:TIGR01456 family HAD-type hydrolase [archaeon]|nr:MAG: TIGR01456 family HAD-type hydrolase [archaeon]
MRKAVALDIDGVILRGGKVIKGAHEAVKKLITAHVPFIFVSNGGGVHEEHKADQLSSKLGLHIRKEQIILCHTPFSSLARKYGSNPVLILGQESCLDVARAYGFQSLYRPIDFYNNDPQVLPTRKTGSQGYQMIPPIELALIFHDPEDWSLDMQVLSDVLVSHKSGEKPVQTVPLYGCNLDLVYNNEHRLPRFTQGAFIDAFQSLFEKYHCIPLQITKYGKPYRIQYEFAELMLRREAERMHGVMDKNTVYFGIGDNPMSDIKGANEAGTHWSSILVRTGLFQSSKDNDDAHPADHVCESVNDAIEYILKI